MQLALSLCNWILIIIYNLSFYFNLNELAACINTWGRNGQTVQKPFKCCVLEPNTKAIACVR